MLKTLRGLRRPQPFTMAVRTAVNIGGSPLLCLWSFIVAGLFVKGDKTVFLDLIPIDQRIYGADWVTFDSRGGTC